MKTIMVNTRPKAWYEDEISYEQCVILAHGSINPDVVYTVTYLGKRVKDSRRAGSLIAGESVAVDDGMSFDVFMTGNA